MMTLDEKANLSRKLTHALHQAPDNPDLFANILRSVVKGSGLHITDLSVTTGNLTTQLHEELQDARRDAKPTFETLIDIAGKKINLGKRPERALAEALGVTAKNIEDHKKVGRVPRMWLDKIKSLADLDETRAEFDAETQQVIEILAEKGYSPGNIQDLFGQIRTTRAGLKQIEKVVFGSVGQIDSEELKRMKHDLFGSTVDSKRRFEVWLATHLRTGMRSDPEAGHNLNLRKAEKLRGRFRREIEMRESDAAYRRIAAAAELIERPLAGGGRSAKTNLVLESRLLCSRLDDLFGDEAPDRRNRRLAQLTGLDDRHTLDLLNGANGVNEAWWNFLAQVEAAAAIKKN